MLLIAEKGDSVQVENEKSQIGADQEKFKEKILAGMKENLFLSMLSFIWNKVIDEIASMDNEKENLQKDFIDLWKKNINEITQEQLETINKILNDSNIDMINIISGKSSVADVEDYQSTINSAIKEIEKIFWKMCGK
jgi:succinate dehydrogenase flavin-adding protein (antitoxin of CptAB toxin-antitoxin module)